MWLIRQCLEYWNTELKGSPELTIGPVVEAAAAIAARDYVLNVDDPDLLAHGNMPQRINGQLRSRGLPEFSIRRGYRSHQVSALNDRFEHFEQILAAPPACCSGHPCPDAAGREEAWAALKAGYGFAAQALGTRKEPASHKPTASTTRKNEVADNTEFAGIGLSEGWYY